MDMFWDGPKYTDREEAGRVLGDQLVPYKDEDPVIVAIPNGGVAVADAYNVWRDLTDEKVILLPRASKGIG
jgi:predicted phosphoribosyltransferase